MTARLSNQPRILQDRLEKLSASEIVQFDAFFAELLCKSFTWELWAAAYIIEGGCGDDGFQDFRAGLIGLGRETYEAAVNDPNTLSLQPASGVDFSNEGMLYAAPLAFEVVTGKKLPKNMVPQPDKPVGERWDASELSTKFPGLAAAFDFDL
jgi:hypothetical protein